MDLSKQALFQTLNQRMRYLGERQKVLAQNVANADTPGYHARDMQPVDFVEAVQRSMHRQPMAATQVGHLPPVTPPSAFAIDRVKRTYETKLDKNNVVIEEQMMKVADTQHEYGVSTQLYKKYIDMMKMSVGH